METRCAADRPPSTNRTCTRRRQRLCPLPEALEIRRLLSAAVESVDGTGNNLAHPTWGGAGTDLLRTAPAAYGDGVSAPAGADRPGARAISNALCAQSPTAKANNRSMSAFVYAWGQFIDHDLSLTNPGTPADALNIAVPAGDPQFDPTGAGTQVIPLNRSAYDPATGTGIGNPRQQVTSVTSWIDASMVYGSDPATAASLRTFTGGRLKTSTGDLLPTDSTGQFSAGDVRAEENPELTSIQTLFLREHNRIAGQIARSHPGLTDEQVYQQARQQVIAEIQSITYNEFLPALLGPAAPGRYRGYNPNVNPAIANEFSAAAYRFGHSLIGDDTQFLDNNGNPVRPAVSLANAFFDPSILSQTGIDPVLKYLASDRSEEEDLGAVDSLRNLLFGQPGAGGMDLMALDIQRGRDHGLADYNTTRAAYGLPRVTTFAQITSDVQVQHELQQVYGSVDNIDLFVGGLAEDHLAGSSLGVTFARVIANQFERTRDGDRFWFEHTFGGALSDLENTKLSDVIRRNTAVSNLQPDVFFFNPSVSGRVFADANADGRLQPGEAGLAGVSLQLLGSDGSVLATTTTTSDGTYRFTGLDLGAFQVRELSGPGTTLTSPALRSVRITRGGDSGGTDFGRLVSAPPPAAPRPPQPLQQPPPPPLAGPLPPPQGPNPLQSPLTGSRR